MHHIISMIQKEVKAAGITPLQLINNLPNKRSLSAKRITKNILAILSGTKRPCLEDIPALIYAVKGMRIEGFLDSVLADKASANKALKSTLVLCEEKFNNIYTMLPYSVGSYSIYPDIYTEMQMLRLEIKKLGNIVDDQLDTEV